ncbi:MAG TPA: hypothetical protein VM513_04725 [Kofleriaceae bacterium]|jgi:hypothetical protein|nr:hypothetical protein [Kofleriaceae bacterium]
MRKLRLRTVLPFLAIALAAAAWSACKQEEGERCQIDEDCSDGLLCNKATQQCARTSGGGIDATVPIDAPEGLDSPTDSDVDAPDDGPIDAEIDAPPDA